MADFSRANEYLRELALFAGAGGGILGGKLLGWRTVCAVEIEPYAACVLAARQNDGILPPFPIWDDVRAFDGRPWGGLVDVVSGGFPCQDISAAGRGAGITGERSGLWREFARIIGEVRPRYVFVENSPMLTSRGLGTVLGDLAALGFDAEWGVLSAAEVGAPHKRDRIWILANANSAQRERDECAERAQPEYSHADRTSQLAYTENKRDVRRFWGLEAIEGKGNDRRSQTNGRGEWWATEPDVGRVADGVAARVDRLKAIGNGQVPRVAASAWRLGVDYD